MYEISSKGFHDKLIINFSRVSIEEIDLNRMFDALLLKLLWLKFKYNSFNSHPESATLRFGMRLCKKLFTYSKYNTYKFFGTLHLDYFSYLI